MKQMTLEVELDSRLVKPEDEIAARLAALRDEVPKKEMEIEKVFVLLIHIKIFCISSVIEE